MKLIKEIITLIVVIIGVVAVIVGINTWQFNNSIDQNRIKIKNNPKKIYVSQNINTEIKRGRSYNMYYQCNKGSLPKISYKNDEINISNQNILSKIRRTMRYGGNNEKLIIYVPKNIKLNYISIKTQRGILIKNINSNKIYNSNKYGDNKIYNSNIKFLNIKNKFGDTIIEKSNINSLKVNTNFGDIKSKKSKIKKIQSSIHFGNKDI